MAVTTDILRSWRDPVGVVRDLLARGVSEKRLVVFLAIVCGVLFVAQWPGLARQAVADPSIPLQARMTGAFFACFFIAPLLIYLFAALTGLAMWLIRRRISGHAARLAVFWSLLAASPAWLAVGLLTGLIGPGAISAVLGVAGLVAFFWLFAGGLRAAALEARAASA